MRVLVAACTCKLATPNSAQRREYDVDPSKGEPDRAPGCVRRASASFTQTRDPDHSAAAYLAISKRFAVARSLSLNVVVVRPVRAPSNTTLSHLAGAKAQTLVTPPCVRTYTARFRTHSTYLGPQCWAARSQRIDSCFLLVNCSLTNNKTLNLTLPLTSISEARDKLTVVMSCCVRSNC